MEQVEDIKENDEFWVRVRIKRTNGSDIWFCPMFPSGRVDAGREYWTPECAIFAKKVTPFDQCTCRKLKKGDEVSLLRWSGNLCPNEEQAGYTFKYKEKTGIVVVEETPGGLVGLSVEGYKYTVFVPSYKLSLIIPAEERMPYYVVHNTSENSFDICRMYGDRPVVRQSFFYAVGAHEGKESVCNAELTEGEANLAAAEECERLNDEYSKEQE